MSLIPSRRSTRSGTHQHLFIVQGRPKAGPEDKFRLLPVQKRLAELLGMQVKYAMDCIGSEAKTIADELQNGEVRILGAVVVVRGVENMVFS